MDATTDLHYTFGARWRITVDGAVVLDTSAHPLFATAEDTHAPLAPRTYTPGAAVTADWNMVAGGWNGHGTLLTAWPALPMGFPNPVVDNS